KHNPVRPSHSVEPCLTHSPKIYQTKSKQHLNHCNAASLTHFYISLSPGKINFGFPSNQPRPCFLPNRKSIRLKPKQPLIMQCSPPLQHFTSHFNQNNQIIGPLTVNRTNVPQKNEKEKK